MAQLTPVIAHGGATIGYIVRNEHGSYFVQSSGSGKPGLRLPMDSGARRRLGVNILHAYRDGLMGENHSSLIKEDT